MHYRFTHTGANTARKVFFRRFGRRFRRSCNYPSGGYRYEKKERRESPEKKTHAERVRSLAERMKANFNILDQRRNRAAEKGKRITAESWSKLHTYYREMWNRIQQKHNRICGRNFETRNKVLSELDALLDNFDTKIVEWDAFYKEAYAKLEAQELTVKKPEEKSDAEPEEQSTVSRSRVMRKEQKEEPEVTNGQDEAHIARSKTRSTLQNEAAESNVSNFVEIEKRQKTEEVLGIKPRIRHFSAGVGDPFFIELTENMHVSPKIKAVTFDDPFDNRQAETTFQSLVPNEDTLNWRIITEEKKVDDVLVKKQNTLYFKFKKPGTAHFIVYDEANEDAAPVEYIVTAKSEKERKADDDRSQQYIEEVARRQQRQESLGKQIYDVEDTIKREGTADVFRDEEPPPFDEIVDSAISMLKEDPASFLAIVTLNQQLHATDIEAYKAKQQHILEKGKHIESADGSVWQIQLDNEGKFVLKEIQ